MSRNAQNNRTDAPGITRRVFFVRFGAIQPDAGLARNPRRGRLPSGTWFCPTSGICQNT